MLKRSFYTLDHDMSLSANEREVRTTQLFTIKRKLEPRPSVSSAVGLSAAVTSGYRGHHHSRDRQPPPRACPGKPSR